MWKEIQTKILSPRSFNGRARTITIVFEALKMRWQKSSVCVYYFVVSGQNSNPFERCQQVLRKRMRRGKSPKTYSMIPGEFHFRTQHSYFSIYFGQSSIESAAANVILTVIILSHIHIRSTAGYE